MNISQAYKIYKQITSSKGKVTANHCLISTSYKLSDTEYTIIGLKSEPTYQAEGGAVYSVMSQNNNNITNFNTKGTLARVLFYMLEQKYKTAQK